MAPRAGGADLGDNGGVEHVVVGREAEIAALERFLGPESSARALSLCGDAGIGKTTLWEAGVDLARARGVVVAAARGSEEETRLSFACLSDLLDGIDIGSVAGVPRPQVRALEVALGRADPLGVVPEPLTIYTGFLGVLRAWASRDSVLIAVDDVALVDAESGAALAFAARRLAGRQVRFLLSSRTGRISGLEDTFGPTELDRVDVETLSFGAITQVLLENLGPLPRRVLRRVFETSGGNPLFALELGRALVEHGIPAIGQHLPVPDRLDDLFAARISALDEPLRRVLLAVVLGAGLTRLELAGVIDPAALEDGIASGLLVVGGQRVRPSHPLLASAALRASTSDQRRELHRELARCGADAIARARHSALASAGPDAALAARVASAATLASERGAVEDAVELAEHALRLTPADAAEHSDRVLELASRLHVAGDVARATELLTDSIEDLPAGPARARAHLLLGEAAIFEEDHLDRALAESGNDPELRAMILTRRSIALSLVRVERIAEAETLALDALMAAQSMGPELESEALTALAWARILQGRSIDDLRERITTERSLEISHSSVDRPAGVRHAFRGEVDQARAVFRRLLALADERGEARSSMVLLTQLCELELRAGNASEATRLLDEWESGVTPEMRVEFGIYRSRLQAAVAALVGVPDRSIALAASAIEAAGSDPLFRWNVLEATRATGAAALFDRDAERAVTSLQEVWEHTVREGVDDPGAFPVCADLVEALVETGKIREAQEATERLRTLASEQRHPWGLATAERCAAMIGLADGYVDEAAARLIDASNAYETLGLRFDRARCLLYLGRMQRRANKRADARHSFEEAATEFERLGCAGWAEQARAELARVSGRRPAKERLLTPGERRVAELAASGLANKEIASRLFVSVYTVETQLKSTYAKLGIHSRTQLAQRLASYPPAHPGGEAGI